MSQEVFLKLHNSLFWEGIKQFPEYKYSLTQFCLSLQNTGEPRPVDVGEFSSGLTLDLEHSLDTGKDLEVMDPHFME